MNTLQCKAIIEKSESLLFFSSLTSDISTKNFIKLSTSNEFEATAIEPSDDEIKFDLILSLFDFNLSFKSGNS